MAQRKVERPSGVVTLHAEKLIMEMISSCPKCGAEYTISEEFFDRPLQCQNCQNIFTVARPANGQGGDIGESFPQKNCRQKIKQFVVKHKKWIIALSCVLFLVIAVLISLSVMHKNYYRLPKPLLHVASYAGTPLQRARAFRRLAILANNETIDFEEKDKIRRYYFDKGAAVLEGCKETAPVLSMKIALKYRHDISGWVSEEAERLIQIDKSYIFSYVTAKYELYPRQFGEREAALLKEYEKYMLEKFKQNEDIVTAVALGRLYYFDVPGFPRDLERMESYLLKAKEFSQKQKYFWYKYLLLECYIMQGKFEQLDSFAEEFVRDCSDNNEICSLAHAMFCVYSGKYSSVERFVRDNGELITPKDDEKAARGKTLVKKRNPHLIL